MDPVTLITAGIAALDWLISNAEASGEEIPQEHLDTRTAFRKELVRLVNDEGSGTPD